MISLNLPRNHVLGSNIYDHPLKPCSECDYTAVHTSGIYNLVFKFNILPIFLVLVLSSNSYTTISSSYDTHKIYNACSVLYTICLRKHMPIHSGEWPFSCKMRGTRLTNFNIYVLYRFYSVYAHKQIQSYPCLLLHVEICGTHMLIQSGDNPTLCMSCASGGIHNNYFNRYMAYIYHNTSFNISFKHMLTHISCTFCGIYNIYINRIDSYTVHSNVSILYLCDCCVIYMFTLIVLVYYCQNYIIKSSSLILRL